jgi:phosphate transport system protein
MHSHLEESLQHDIDRIRDYVGQMSRRVEKALQDCVKSFTENNRSLAYAVILRDAYVDEKEKEIDRLCLEFIIRQQPVALPLRFAYSTIKITLELERVGDYAESIARQVVKLHDFPVDEFNDGVVELANVAIGMFRDATLAFVKQDADLARKNIESWESADARRTELNAHLVEQFQNQKISFEAFDALMAIIRRFERVADQARNICLEAIYMCTGEFAKHPGASTFRLLFVDDHNSCQSQMAEAIAESLNLPRFIFSSAGVEPRPIDNRTLAFMKKKGFDLSRVAPKAVVQIPHLGHYQMIVALSRDALRAFPSHQRKVILLDWPCDELLQSEGSAASIDEAFERTFDFIKNQVHDLVEAITDTSIERSRLQ